MTVQGIGAPVKRREDFRFIKGIGKYTDDINLPNQVYCYILRSSIAHARIVSIDTSAASAAPGVVAIYTHQDIDASGAGGVPCGWLITSKDGTPMKEPKHPILASGKVRHVGDPIVAILAESLEEAKEAAELVKLDLQELSAVVNMPRALGSGGTPVHDKAPDNLCYDWELGDKAATDAAFRGPPISQRSISSTIGSCRTPWSRGLPSASTISPPGNTPSTPQAKIRMLSGS